MLEVRFIYPKVLARHRARGVLSCGLDETLVEEKMAEADAQIRFLEACQQAEPHTMVAPGEAYLAGLLWTVRRSISRRPPRWSPWSEAIWDVP
jgi:hypothetical protein